MVETEQDMPIAVNTRTGKESDRKPDDGPDENVYDGIRHE
jgi:hypothetical protein